MSMVAINHWPLRVIASTQPIDEAIMNTPMAPARFSGGK